MTPFHFAAENGQVCQLIQTFKSRIQKPLKVRLHFTWLHMIKIQKPLMVWLHFISAAQNGQVSVCQNQESINKSQGQTLKHCGLYLENECFSHGQFYVGVSRVGSQKNLKIYAPENKTVNIVYQEILQDCMDTTSSHCCL